MFPLVVVGPAMLPLAPKMLQYWPEVSVGQRRRPPPCRRLDCCSRSSGRRRFRRYWSGRPDLIPPRSGTSYLPSVSQDVSPIATRGLGVPRSCRACGRMSPPG